jgi:hypothetical protein
MRRTTIVLAVAAILLGIMPSSLWAQRAFRGPRGMGLLRMKTRILHAPQQGFANFGGYGGYLGGTLFDLYRLGKIPIPPYFSLHPPVYYSENVYQPYGSTPFAYPHTWWQQYGYPYVAPPGREPMPATFAVPEPRPVPTPQMIENDYLKEPTAAVDARKGIIRNPFSGSDGWTAEDLPMSVAVVDNPYVSKRAAAVVRPRSESPVSVETVDHRGPPEVANPEPLAQPERASLAQLCR